MTLTLPTKHHCVVTYLIAISIVMVPITAYFDGKGLPVLIVLAGLAALSLVVREQLYLNIKPTKAHFGFAAFLAWCLLSVIWTPDTLGGFKKFGAVFGSSLAGFSVCWVISNLTPRHRNVLLRSVWIGFALTVGLFIFEEFAAYPLSQSLYLPQNPFTTDALYITSHIKFHTNKGICALVFYGLALLLSDNTKIRFILIPVLGITVYIGDSSSATIGLIVGLIIWIFTFMKNERVISFFPILFIVGIMSSPILTHYFPKAEDALRHYSFVPNSAAHRLLIWHNTLTEIEKKPVSGWGMSSSRTFWDSSQKVKNVPIRGPQGSIYYGTSEPIPLHPHNIVLQLWLELGAIGAALFSLVLGFIFIRSKTEISLAVQARLAPIICAIIVTGASGYGAWQGWWLSLLTFSIAILFTTPANAE